jgi:hypothetical protein
MDSLNEEFCQIFKKSFQVLPSYQHKTKTIQQKNID